MSGLIERTRRSFVIGVAGLCAAAALVPADASAATELVVWHAYRGNEKAAFEKVVGSYNASQSGVVVKTLAVPYDAYADKITASIPRGRGPDVFIFAQDRLGGWVEGGQTVESIDFYLEDETVDSLVPNMMDAMTYRDTVYGLPFNYKSIAMIYNTDLVKSPPQTTGELVRIAKQHTDKSTGRFGLAYEYSNYFYHAALMNAFGGQVFGAGATPKIDDPANVKAIDLMMNWFQQDGILPADPSSALISSLFNDGKAAIVFNGPWFVGEIGTGVNYAIAPLPKVDEAGGKPMAPWLTVEGIYVSAGSSHKEEAYDFAKFLISEEAALVMALEGRQLPTNKAVYSNSKVAADPVLSAYRKQLETAVPMPNYAEMTLMWSPVTTAMNKIVKGSASPEVALKEAQQTVSSSIAALRKSR